jgi:hypothetical protein
VNESLPAIATWKNRCPAAWNVAEAVEIPIVNVAAVDDVLHTLIVEMTAAVADGHV